MSTFIVSLLVIFGLCWFAAGWMVYTLTEEIVFSLVLATGIVPCLYGAWKMCRLDDQEQHELSLLSSPTAIAHHHTQPPSAEVHHITDYRTKQSD